MRIHRTFAWLLGALAVAGGHGRAEASAPVPYAVVGCVSNGSFQAPGLVADGTVLPPIRAIEGKTIRIEGVLSPGDRFSARAVFIVDDRCREDLGQGYFLCDPCRTLPGMPHRMLPPQPGTKLDLPPDVLRQFDRPRR
ncbi:hypothetical protein [Blastochloris sulfoviridis]|uniref:Uncharacterized protein n=1 Tax=Blastochloris sulfoviridis TaxID=50712 RepID=A0A5M6HIB4_9HYPH|nr:hypothetical protein [Blastochloris sulfoviridis]KAA5595600.1 hypothetical protein F1193_16485 [Blastochloris sulfoviridis]